MLNQKALFTVDDAELLQVHYLRALRSVEGLESRDFYQKYHGFIYNIAHQHGIRFENAVIVFARLSPRTNISINTNAFIELISGKERVSGITARLWKFAEEALYLSEAEIHKYLYEDALTKVRAFARNLLLDSTCVCLDSIMLRILKYTHNIPNRYTLFSKYSEIHGRVYKDIAVLDDTVPPYMVQATLWGYARNRLPAIAED